MSLAAVGAVTQPQPPAMPTQRTPNTARLSSLRVIKKLHPGARGAKALTERYGDQLVCIRHRVDESGLRRLTTVEVVVAERAIRRTPGPTVDIALQPHERKLRERLKAAGGKWDEQDQVWWIRRSTAVALGLKSRIVPR